MYVPVCARMCVHMCECACVYMCVCVCIRVCACVNVHVCVFSPGMNYILFAPLIKTDIFGLHCTTTSVVEISLKLFRVVGEN